MDSGRHSQAKKYLGILAILAASSFASILFSVVPTAVNAAGPDVDLGAIAITCSNDGSGLYTEPYDQQIAQNMMRDWGIPFDTTDVSRITSETFWDSAHQINKYQFIVYFGCTAFSTEPTLSSTIRNALAGAIANGTNAIFVGAAVYNWMNLFGLSLSGTGDCPSNPQAGGGSCFTAGNALVFGIRSSFCGITSGDTCWVKGKAYDANNTADWPSGNAVPDVKMPTLSWNGTHGAEFMNATANGVVYPNTIYRNYGNNHAQIWWYGATEGLFADYLQGWAGTFDNTEFSGGCAYGGCSYYQGFAPEVQLFYYALNNVTRYPVSIMPWATDGSAEIIRVEDHSSICTTFTACSSATGGDSNVAGMESRDVVGEINVNLNGWSNSVPLPLTAGLPPGATNSPCTTGYQYYGRLTSTWNSRYFLTCAKVNNATATSTSALSTPITTTHSSTIDMSDGNTTTITKAEVLVSTTGSPSWTLSFIDSKGNKLWTSSAQNTPLSSATWVKFSNINFTGADAGHVSDIQGNDELKVTVTSGTVVWHNQSSSSSNYVLTGRGGWDIVYIDPTAGTNNFAAAIPIMPDSIRMASGALYPRANSTFYIRGVPGLVQPADIAGDGNTGAPTAANIQTFFNATDWSTHGATQVSNWKALVALGWQIDTNGWTHAKVASGSNDNDFVYGNGTAMGAAEMAKRVNDIRVMLDNVIGSAYVSADWAFGTAGQTFYPGTAQMVAGGFMEAQLATQNVGTQSFVTAGFYQSSATGGGSLYGIGQGSKVAGGEGWLSSYNETRDMQGIIESHSDSTSPWNDFDQALSIKATQSYDKNSTWFTTTADALNFWNATLYAMQHTKTFMWNPSTNQVTLTFYSGTSRNVDKTNFNDPIVFRLPETLDSLGFTSGSDNETSGSLTNSTANWRYYQVNVGHKWTSFTFTYSETTTTLTVSTKPMSIPSGFSFDRVNYSSPQTFTVYINSVHAVSAPSPVSCGSLCEWSWSSWTDSGTKSHEYTVPGPTPTLSAIYAQTSLVPSGVLDYVPIAIHNTGSTNWASGTQWKVLVDWSAYSSHLASNLDNVVFFDGSGSILTSWNENASSSSVTKGLVWTLSQVPLASGSTYTIYMGFYPTSTDDYSPAGNWGEAPTLSSTYAQYDNGALVFPAGYWNFAGASLPAGWTGSGEVVNNGLTVPGERSYAYTSATTYGLNASLALDMYGNITEPSPAGVYSCAGYVPQDSGTTCSVASGRDLATWTLNSGHQTVDAFGMSSLTGSGLQYVDGADAHGIRAYTIMWPSTSQVSFSSGYGALHATSGGQVPDVNLAIGAASSSNNNYNQGLGPFNWMRLRVGGGEFDTSTLGSLTTVFTLTTSAGAGGTVVPSTEGWGSGATVHVEAVPSNGYEFNAWTCTGSGCVAGSSNPIAVTMNSAISETASFNSLALGVTLPMEVCLQEPGAASGTFGLSGAGVSQTTITGAYSCSSVNLSVSPSSTVVVTVPADGSDSRYRMNASSTSPLTEDVPTCASGTCATVKIDSYYQLNNTYGAAPANPSAWDFSGSVAVKGTIAGSSGQTGCSISTTSGHGAAACASYFDYGRAVTIASPVVVSSTERWVQSCGSAGDQFTATTGGSLYSCNYGRQWQVQFAVSPSSSYGSVSPSSTSFYNDGNNGTTLPVVGTASSGHAFSSWSASSSSITFASSSSSSTIATIEAAGTIDATFVGTQSESTVTLTCTMSNGAPADTVALSESSGNNPSPTSVLCDGLPHAITTDASATLTATAGACSSSCEHRFNPSGTLVTTLSIQAPSAGGSESWSFHDYMILGNTYTAVANAQTDFDTSMSCALTGTIGGNSSSSNSISSTAAASDSSTVYFDYNTQVAFCATFSSAPAHSQWARTGAYQFTETTGGNALTVQYWKQWTNSFEYSVADGGSPATPTLTCNQFGLPATLMLAGTPQPFYCDNSAKVSATDPISGGTGERWSDDGQSTTVAFGGSTVTFAYYDQHSFSLDYQVNGGGTPTAPTLTSTQFGKSYTPTLTSTPLTYWLDDGQSWSVTNPLTDSGATQRWETSQTTSGTVGASSPVTASSGLVWNYYDQYHNTFAASPTSNGGEWDAALSITVTGNEFALPVTGCMMSTSSGGGSANCASWFDSAATVTMASPLSVSGTEQWAETGGNVFTPISGGNTENVNYVRQWTLAIALNPSNCGTSNPVAGTTFQTDGSSIAGISVTPIQGCTFAAWTGTGSGSYTGTNNPISITMGGPITETASFNSGVTLPMEVCLQEPGAASGAFGLSGAGVSQTTITGAYSCSSVNLSVSPSSTVVVTVPADGSDSRYRMNGSSTSPLTEDVPTCASGTCATVKIDSYYQLNNTYGAAPANPSAWDFSGSVAVTGTQFGSTGQTGCTLATAIGGGAVVCAAWFDYDTQATIGSPVNVSANERWAQACGSGGNQFTQTTGGNLDTCNFVMELQNAYACNPSIPSTFDGAYACTATGTLAGVASSTICSVNAASGGGSVNCSGYADYGDAVSLPSSLGSWTVSGTHSWTGTTGGNVLTANYDEIPLSGPTIAVSPATLDSGQSSTISTINSFGGGASPYTCQWLIEVPGGVSYGDLGGSFGCATTSMPTESTGTLTATGSWSFELQVTDSATKTVTSNAVSVTVNSALSGVTLGSFTTNPVVTGQPDSIPISWSGGTSTYTVTLYYSTSSSSCSPTNAQAAQSTGLSSSPKTMTLTAPSPAGTYYYCATVKDSLGGSAASSTSGTILAVTAPALVAPAISVSPAVIDSGQTSTLSTITPFSGGTSPYTCQWLKEAPGGSYSNLGGSFTSGCNSSSLPTISTGALSATGTWHFELQVKDSASKTVTSTAVSVTVNSALAAPTVSSSPTTVDRGQPSSLTSTKVTTGTPTYTYQWLAEAPGAKTYSTVSGATSSSYTFATSASTATGTWHFELKVTDSASKTVTSTAVSLTVNPALVAPIISSSHATVNRGQSSSLTSTKVTTGTPSYTYQWLAEAPGATSYSTVSGATSPSYTFATSASTTTGTWHFELVVTDSTGAVVISNVVSVTVNP